MNIKYNINKLHSELCSTFGDVAISEKSDKKFGNYVELVINEKYQVRMIIPIMNFANENVNWFYYANPTNESGLIERKSDINFTSKIVKDIIDHKRFDSEYIESIN